MTVDLTGKLALTLAPGEGIADRQLDVSAVAISADSRLMIRHASAVVGKPAGPALAGMAFAHKGSAQVWSHQLLWKE